MKTWKILRDCRLKGDGIQDAMSGIARLHNLSHRIDDRAGQRSPPRTDPQISYGTSLSKGILTTTSAFGEATVSIRCDGDTDGRPTCGPCPYLEFFGG